MPKSRTTSANLERELPLWRTEKLGRKGRFVDAHCGICTGFSERALPYPRTENSDDHHGDLSPEDLSRPFRLQKFVNHAENMREVRKSLSSYLF